MTANLKNFRMQTFRVMDSGPDDQPENNTAASIKKRHKREIARAERENRENTSAMLELRDMEDELRTLNKLFDTQHDMITRMSEIYSGEGLKEVTEHGRGYLQEALGKLAEYKIQTTEMLDRVGSTRGDVSSTPLFPFYFLNVDTDACYYPAQYEKMLEMVQRQAQVDDVRWSRLQTELASSQNLSVMIFTIFTVIFLPLSFFTSLFGMNTREWDGNFPTLGYIGEISLPLSAFMILATFVAAFNPRVQTTSQGAYRRAARLTQSAWAGVKKLQPAAARRAQERRRAEKECEARGWTETRRREREYDFWATIKKQRSNLGMHDEIPGANKNEVMTGAASGNTRGLDGPRQADRGAATAADQSLNFGGPRSWKTT